MNFEVVKKQPWWQLLSIQAGGVISLPVILAGSLLYEKFGWLSALLAVFVGNFFLLCVGFIFASLSTKRPQTTVRHAIFSFGNQGGPFFATIMILSMIGWFAIQLNLMSLSLHQLLKLSGFSISTLVLNLSIGVMLSGLLCFGMKTLKTLCNFCAPLFFCTLIYAVITSKGTLGNHSHFELVNLGGVSLIIGTSIAAVIDLPTFFQYAQSKKDARIAIFLLYALVVPFIEIVGIYLTSAAHNRASILTILEADRGLAWILWISIFIFLSGWATNNSNLYSSIASSYSFPLNWNLASRTIVLGCLGTLIAIFNPLHNLESILTILSVTIGSMGAIMLSSHLWEKITNRNEPRFWISFVSWIVGVSLGLSSIFFKIEITTVPAFDSFFTSSIVFLILKMCYDKAKLTKS